MTRAFLGLVALLFLPYGAYCFAQPGALEGIAGVASTSTTGSTELRAMYGGVQMAVGALALFALFRPELVRPMLLVVAFLGGGLGLSRLAGAALDDGWSLYTGMGLGLEFGMLGLASTLLRREPART
jgi:hypothetical protein